MTQSCWHAEQVQILGKYADECIQLDNGNR